MTAPLPTHWARDHRISRATAYRYMDEVIAVLAGEAPGLHQALERARAEGLPHVILDGTVIPADRRRQKTLSVSGKVIDLWYTGKAHAHGGNLQAVIAPDGFPLWVSEAEPGSVHDHTAARIHALPALYRAAATGLPALADPGYDGAGHRGTAAHFVSVMSESGVDVDAIARLARHFSFRTTEAIYRHELRNVITTGIDVMDGYAFSRTLPYTVYNRISTLSY